MPNASYRRHLPHFDAVGRAVFVTWNLKGALPAAALRRIREERETIARLFESPPPRSASPNENPNVGRLCKPTLQRISPFQNPPPTSTANVRRLCKPTHPLSNKDSLLLDHARKIFRISEDFLDRAERGPRFLIDPNLAAAARDAILEGANKWYLLIAFVVMPNHVHLLIRPTVPLDRITMAIKRRAAKEINLRRNTPGHTIWQDESFDHFPRDAAAISRIIAYIERNPVAAGLCPRETDWPFSSAPPAPRLASRRSLEAHPIARASNRRTFKKRHPRRSALRFRVGRLSRADGIRRSAFQADVFSARLATSER